jgi:DNA-binding NarL/FixJ family response regulator
VSPAAFGLITTGEPDGSPLPAGWRAITLHDLPAEPFALGDHGLAVLATVDGEDVAADVLVAAARGCAVVARVDLESAAAAQFLEDLGRLVDLRPLRDAAPLDVEQVALLERLAEGDTVTGAARQLGWSRRTATRRLEEAKRRLGVSSTSEAVRVFRHGG